MDCFLTQPNGVVIYKLDKEVLEMNTKKGTERFHLPSVEGSNQADIIHDFGKVNFKDANSFH